jgi:hypothetical protein
MLPMHRPDETPYRTEFEARHPEILDPDYDNPAAILEAAVCGDPDAALPGVALLREKVCRAESDFRQAYPPRRCQECGVRLCRYNPGPCCFLCTDRLHRLKLHRGVKRLLRRLRREAS